MNCLVLFDSGNYVFNLCRILEQKGYVFEIISTPCHIAKSGCGYCLKIPEKFIELVLKEASINKTPVREIYRIIPTAYKNKYEKIF
jgi:hypothetical protein